MLFSFMRLGFFVCVYLGNEWVWGNVCHSANSSQSCFSLLPAPPPFMHSLLPSLICTLHLPCSGSPCSLLRDHFLPDSTDSTHPSRSSFMKLSLHCQMGGIPSLTLHLPPFHGLCPFPPQCPLTCFCYLVGCELLQGETLFCSSLCPLYHIALLEVDSQQTFLRQLNKCMALWIYLASTDFTLSGGGRSEAGAFWGEITAFFLVLFCFCLCAEAPMCTLQPASLCTLHMRPQSLGSCLGCVCGGSMWWQPSAQ